jgi:predicted nucleic acid-binding protein
MSYSLARTSLTLITLTLTAGFAPAQIKEPPRAAKMDVQIRYRIRADRDERIRQYRVLEKYLAALGFVDARKDDPDRDLDILDPNAERFVGTIPGDKVLDILGDVRVQDILFAPSGFAYPDGPDKPVAVRIGLRGGLLPNVQQQLHTQTVAQLAKLGFVEALGYDTKGYTLVRGSIPYKNLDLLVKDVRTEPSGWFLAATPLDQLPTPLRDRNPLRWTEVLPITEFAPPFVPPPVLPAQYRYSADLRAALLDPALKDAPIRVEAVFLDRIAGFDVLRNVVQGRYAGASLDGLVGNVASLRFARPSLAEAFASEPGVSYVRLPRQGWETLAAVPGGKGDTTADALKAARLDGLHKLGYTGAGVKVLLIGSDFSGAERFIGTELPKRTRVVDLTTELTPELVPARADPTRLGSGTAAARVLAATAPDCDLVLVRIDPGCLFFLRTVVALSRGELSFTDALQVRLAELAARSSAFDYERRLAIDAYRTAFSDLTDNEVAVALRKKAKADLDALLVKEKALTALIDRFNTYQKDITSAVAGAQVIVNTLSWESGYPMDALSDFSGTLERLASVLPPRVVKRAADPAAAPKPPLVWVQAAGSAGAAVWGGPFLDANRDGLMEFVPPGTKLPADNWSPQLNFLGTRSVTGEVSADLIKDAKLRLVVQWREPADPNFPETDVPAFPLVLRFLRQIDPTGEKRSSDEMEELARSVTVPNVIARTRTYLVFEQMLEFTVPVAGRYALAIESAQVAEPLLPALRRELEIFPRVVIETVGTAASDPRAVFRSFTTTSAGVGVPGDSLGAITVGTAEPGEQLGGGTGVTLRQKPDVLGPMAFLIGTDSYRGPGAATAFAGGAAALLVQTRAARPNVFFSAGIEPGKPLEIPSLWLRNIRPAEKGRP